MMDPETFDLLSGDESEAEEAPGRYVTVLKVGGNELDDAAFLTGLANAVQAVLDQGHMPVIVHGGGKTIAAYQQQLGLEPKFLDGLRITDEKSLDVAEMVLSGLMNKRIVRALVDAGIRAAGLSGVDDGTIYVEPMWHPAGDLGRVGDIQDVDTHLLRTLIDAEIVPVVSPISLGAHDGLSYNVNADHAAAAIVGGAGRHQACLYQQRARRARRHTRRTCRHRRAGRSLDQGGHYPRRHDSQNAQCDRGSPSRRCASSHHQPGRRAGRQWHKHSRRRRVTAARMRRRGMRRRAITCHVSYNIHCEVS